MEEEPGRGASSPGSRRRVRPIGINIDLPAVDDIEVMVVDDERTSLTLFEAAVLRLGHPVRAFSSSLEAVQAIEERPPQILVTDMVMPDRSGLDLARLLRSTDPDARVILVTAYGDDETAAATQRLGVTAYLAKPVALADLSHAVQRAYLSYAADRHHREMVNWAYEAMARNADELREVTVGTLSALMNAMDARSEHFRGHSRAVALQAAAIAESLRIDDEEIDAVRTAGLLHDVGMIAVPDAIVDKAEALSEEEAELIRQHPETGASILAPIQHLRSSVTYVLQHHERLDGTGYPDGLRGDEISLGGQIVGIAEAWSGLIERRAFQEGRSREEALELLRKQAGAWFESDIVEALAASDLGLMG